MVGTHSLGFLLAPVAPEVLGDLCFPWVQVFLVPHLHLEHLEGPGNHRTAVRTEINPKTFVLK